MFFLEIKSFFHNPRYNQEAKAADDSLYIKRAKTDIITPMTISHVQKNRGLTQAFKRYQKRYLALGKKPNVKKFLAKDLYHTMRLEGEKISRKEANALFR